jgi:hypothetical protein
MIGCLILDVQCLVHLRNVEYSLIDLMPFVVVVWEVKRYAES